MRTGRLVETAQGSFGFEESEAPSSPEVAEGPVRFERGQRQRLFIGDTPLPRYLESVGQGWVAQLVHFLQEEVDFAPFEAAYKPGGRPPFHPSLLLGLVLYGMLLRQWSLRELEALAKRDVGAWWVCAGVQPDHSTIGDFCLRHLSLLTEDFFLWVTRAAVRKLKLAPGEVAGDGTVVEAAASLAAAVKKAALEAQAEEARAALAAAPQDARAQQKAARLEAARVQLAAREAAREAVGKEAEGVRVCTSEPTAMLQPRKDGAVRPSYKPNVLVHEAGLIVGQHLHPSNEGECVAPTLVHHGQVFEAQPTRAYWDAGFCTLLVLQLVMDAQLDALIPSGKAQGEEDFCRKGNKGRYAKAHFLYSEETDSYCCPAGKTLHAGSMQTDGAGRTYREYANTAACRGCPLREGCTGSKAGRRLRRFEGEALKEAMAQVLAQPAAKRAYRRRAPMVEPVFDALKHRQGLTRFHRKGTAKVAMEFALHCTAYNLKRVVGRPAAAVRLLLYARLPGAPWLLVDAGVLLHVA
jgi:transposase